MFDILCLIYCYGCILECIIEIDSKLHGIVIIVVKLDIMQEVWSNTYQDNYIRESNLFATDL